MNHKYFISHSSKDKALARKIAKLFEERKIDYFLDEKSIGWGAEIKEEIDKGLSEYSSLILIISEASLNSQWVSYEVGRASGLEKGILPYVTDTKIELPAVLKNRKYVKSLKEVEDHLDELGKTLGSVGAAFGSVDDIGGQVKRHIKREPQLAEEPSHRVNVRPAGSEVHVLYNEGKEEKVLTKITYADIARLGEESHSLIQTFEAAMKNSSELWKKIYPQKDLSPDPLVNAKVDLQLDDLARKFCSELGNIIKYLGAIGYELKDHYGDIRYVCEQNNLSP